MAPLQELGWNSLRFQAPADWQVDRIGLRYLLLASEAGPALEVTFNPVRGRFSHKKALKKLAAVAARAGFKAAPLPQAWQTALGRYETAGFAWAGNQGSGRGAVLYCPVCHRAVVLQFYGAGAGLKTETAVQVLSSFEDHARGGETLWSIFGFRAETPERFRLTKYRLAAGYVELTLAARAQTLRLYRWGPASALLADRDLAAFARERLGLPRGASFSGAGEEALAWSAARVGPWLWLVRPKSRHDRVRVWRLEEKNRILAVRLAGRRPSEAGLLEALAAKVTSV